VGKRVVVDCCMVTALHEALPELVLKDEGKVRYKDELHVVRWSEGLAIIEEQEVEYSKLQEDLGVYHVKKCDEVINPFAMQSFSGFVCLRHAMYAQCFRYSCATKMHTQITFGHLVDHLLPCRIHDILNLPP
jgi:hypothetical protein